MARPQGGKARRGGKKNRKHGRNKEFCDRYSREGRRERNKARKLTRHLKKFPSDGVARKASEGGPSL